MSTKKKEMNYVYVALALSALLFLGYFARGDPDFPSNGNSHWMKTVTWADGTTETVAVGEDGTVYLNGKETQVFGFHFGSGLNWDNANYEKPLDRIQADGVRFAFVSPNWYHNRYDRDVSWKYTTEKIMDACYRHKFWVLFACNPTDSVSVDQAKNMHVHEVVVNTISQNQNWCNIIFAYSWNWEMDYFFEGTDAELETFFSGMKPKLRSLVYNSPIGEVPLVIKSSGASSVKSVLVHKYSDITCMDIYYRLEGDPVEGTGTVDTELDYVWIDRVLRELHNTHDKLGRSGQKIWYGEWNIWRNNQAWTKEKFQYALTDGGYNNLGALFIWTLMQQYDDNGGGRRCFATFEYPTGDPFPWYTRIAPHFPEVN